MVELALRTIAEPDLRYTESSRQVKRTLATQTRCRHLKSLTNFVVKTSAQTKKHRAKDRSDTTNLPMKTLKKRMAQSSMWKFKSMDIEP